MRKFIGSLVVVMLALSPIISHGADRAAAPGQQVTKQHEDAKIAVAADPIVSYNTNSGKYHCPSCRHAIRCTRNCIDIKKSDAKARGGVACKVCNGSC